MSAYEVKLAFLTDGISAHARLAVRDPLWNEGELLPITPDCMTSTELQHWGERAKAEIDRVVRQGINRFAKLEATRRG